VYTGLREYWRELMHRHRGKIIGTGSGLAFGLLVMLVGPFWALFITLCGVIGYYVGQRFDAEEGLPEALEEIILRTLKR